MPVASWQLAQLKQDSRAVPSSASRRAERERKERLRLVKPTISPSRSRADRLPQVASPGPGGSPSGSGGDGGPSPARQLASTPPRKAGHAQPTETRTSPRLDRLSRARPQREAQHRRVRVPDLGRATPEPDRRDAREAAELSSREIAREKQKLARETQLMERESMERELDALRQQNMRAARRLKNAKAGIPQRADLPSTPETRGSMRGHGDTVLHITHTSGSLLGRCV